MALFGVRPFRTRDPRRDRETDAARTARLHAFLDEMRAEIEQERDGLQGRYKAVTERAAFSQQALELDEAGPEMSSSVDQLTRTMIDYTKRLAALEAQVVFVNTLRERAGLFPHQTDEVEDFAGASSRPRA